MRCERCGAERRLVDGETYRHFWPCGCPVEPDYVDCQMESITRAWPPPTSPLAFERVWHAGSYGLCGTPALRGTPALCVKHPTREGAIAAWRAALPPYEDVAAQYDVRGMGVRFERESRAHLEHALAELARVPVIPAVDAAFRGAWTVPKTEVPPIESQPKFQVGDKVRLVAGAAVGTVTRVTAPTPGRVTVTFGDGITLNEVVDAFELVCGAAPMPFQVGDTVRYRRGAGALGTVTLVQPPDRVCVAFKDGNSMNDVVDAFELVRKDEPFKVGDLVMYVRDGYGSGGLASGAVVPRGTRGRIVHAGLMTESWVRVDFNGFPAYTVSIADLRYVKSNDEYAD